MDWGNDYFTFSDTNIEYIWRFLKRVHERGWLYLGHRSTEWCPRCGTSISAARALAVGRLPGPRRPVALRPLPAARPAGRVARRLDDDAVDAAGERRRRGQAGRRVRPARERRVGRRRALPGRGVRRARSAGAELVGWRYEGPFDELGPARRGRAPRDPVGRGLARRGHRASSTSRPAAAPRTSSSRSVHGLPVLTPVDEAGRFYDDYGWLHGLSTVEAADQIVGDLGERGLPRRGRALRAPLSRTAGAATRR